MTHMVMVKSDNEFHEDDRDVGHGTRVTGSVRTDQRDATSPIG